ncbi:thioredoxin family protein [Joostella sp. CR20]|uniref:thioredoxin family protein n=1 Tax=Joostella sp. CR20 TaxID=2804312 RepID=UPI00313DE012
MSTTETSSKKMTHKKSHPFWKWFWLTFLVLSLAYAWYSFYAPSNEVKWAENITSTRQLANNSNKNTLLFFTGKWCVPCRIMKREVFADTEVEKIINSQVIPVLIDIDNPSTMELVKHFKIGVTPTTIIVNSEGEVLEYAVGKINKKEFLEMLQRTEAK